MSTPGVSLFQEATESLHINTSVPEDEEEALADQRRRNEELGNLLQNAFDDLAVDDDTFDSTHNFQSELQHSHNDKNYPIHEREQIHNSMYLSLPSPPNAPSVESDRGRIDQQPPVTNVDIHKLKMMLESRTHELENIKQIAHEEFTKRDKLEKRLAIAEAELDRALANKKNTHELLVESKEKCSNLENTITKVRNEKKILESENCTLMGKMETLQSMLSDLQQKYNLVERDLGKQSERNTEQRIKKIEERHRAELEIIQQQLEQIVDKLDRKSNELENMTARYHALQNTHEKMLLDKSTTINGLNEALTQAQRKCEELSAAKDYFQDNLRLQKLVSSLQEQISSMEKTINTLTERLEFTTAELDVMDSLLHQNNIDDSPRLSQTHGKVVGSTPLNTVDRVGHLKDELCRALANLKNKRDEIRKLQKTLEDKNVELRKYQEEENRALVEITTLKEEKIRLENRLKLLETELADSRSRMVQQTLNSSKLERTTLEMDQLKDRNNFLEKKMQELERECNKYELERNKIDAQLQHLQTGHQDMKREHDKLKQIYDKLMLDNQELHKRIATEDVQLELDKHKFLLKDAQTECDRLKDLYVEICNAKEALSYEVEKFRSMDSVKELHEQREKVANLQRALQLAELKAEELAKLLETEKVNHERDLNSMREKIEKEKANELKSLKEKSLSNCSKCIDYMAEITKFEIQVLKLNNLSSVNKEEIDGLNQELAKSRELITELTEKLKLSEHQEELIKELRLKAEQFETYIRKQRSSAEKSPNLKQNVSSSSSDKGVGTSPELEMMETKKIEMRIRSEMAKAHAIYLKRYQAAAADAEEKLMVLQKKYQQINVEYKKRDKEVEVLKELILAERDEIGKILMKKDKEHADILDKQNQMLSILKTELKNKNTKLEELTKELDDRQSQIEAERNSMKAVMEQWEEQRKTVDAIENEWKEKLEVYKKSTESAIESLKVKYNSAKRTAANYKRYSEDKEQHMLKEYDRLKYEYDASLVKIERRLKDEFEKKNRELRKHCTTNGKKQEYFSDKENQPDNGVK